MAARKKPAPKASRRTPRRTPKKAAPVPQAPPPPDWAPAFLAALAATGNVSDAARQSGVGRRTAYDRRDAEPDFKAAWADALDAACDALELEARRRALQGVTRPVFGSGGAGVGTVQVGEVQEYSDTLMIFLLKAHRPERFNPPRDVKHSGDPANPVRHHHDGPLTDRIAHLEDAFLGAAAREEEGALPGDGAGEPVGARRDQGGAVPQAG